MAAVGVAQDATAQVVISAIYGAGGNNGATFNRDFVELFNRGSTAVSLNGWAVRYAGGANVWNSSAAGQLATIGDVTLQPGQYYLAGGSSGANGTAFSTSFDLNSGLQLAARNGRVALFSSTNSCATANPTGCPNLVDFVAYGTATPFDGSGAAPAISTTTMAIRALAGCTDTNDNAADFTAVAVSEPRNSASPLNVCVTGPLVPAVTSHSPAAGATDVPRDSSIEIEFNKAVAVATNGIAISCTPEGQAAQPIAHTSHGGSGPKSAYILAPDDDLPVNAECTVTVRADAVEDTESTPQNPTTDYSFSFRTAALLTCGAGASHTIPAVQGTGPRTSLEGSTVSVDGVVTYAAQGTALNGWTGFYIQAEPDGNALTSDAIFVYDPNATSGITVNAGDYVRVTGTVGEFPTAAPDGDVTPSYVASKSETQITAQAGSVRLCDNQGDKPTITPVAISLPFDDIDEQERYEGMLVSLTSADPANQPLTVTELYTFGRYGEISLSAGRLFTPTNYLTPGAAAQEQQRINDRSRIVLDDGLKGQNPAGISYLPGFDFDNPVRHGDTVDHAIVGVLTQSTSSGTYPVRYRLLPTESVNFTASNPRPATAPNVDGTLKVASMNVLNYFNTFTGCYLGGTYTNGNCRGAASTDVAANHAAAFQRQRAKIINAITDMDAAIVGLMEIENDDATDPLNVGVEAVEDLVNGLNAATTAGRYAYIESGRIGTDAIRVAVLYQPGLVTPVGVHAVLDNVDPFNRNSRPPLAQTFEEIASGQTLTVVVNHFKSKGCGSGASAAAGTNADQGDGQGCWNPDRKKAADELLAWLETRPTSATNDDVLILGDLNSYAAEEPIGILTAAGYENLLQAHSGPGDQVYTYVFNGQSGYLDHALASSSLKDKVTGAAVYTINADEASVLDYTLRYKPESQHTRFYSETAYRSSDHDPIIVGLNLAAAPASEFAIEAPVQAGVNRFAFTVRRSGDASQPDTVELGLAGAALPGADFLFVSTSAGSYDPITGVLTFPADVHAIVLVFEVLPACNPGANLEFTLQNPGSNASSVNPAASSISIPSLGVFVATATDATPVPVNAPMALLLLSGALMALRRYASRQNA